MQRWHGYHVFDRLWAKQFDGLHGSPVGGHTYYVDGNNGSDDYSGVVPDWPLKTIAAALAKCVSGDDDYIFVMDCWQEGATISVDKTNVHIIALSSPFATWACLNVATDIDVMQIESTGNNTEIAGFCFGGGNSGCGIYLADSYAVWIHHNTFGHAYAGDTPLYGIETWNSGNPANCLIEDNVFMGDGKSDGKITSNGLYAVQGGSNSFSNSIIRRNKFLGLVGAVSAGAIVIDQCRGIQIEDNRFHHTDAGDGDAINLLADTTHCLIEENRASHGMLSAGNTYNPYRDLNANTLNGWGMNYLNNAVKEPVGI